MDAEQERHGLLWAVQRSARYHARRQAFYDRWRRVTAGVGVIFGSAAATDLLKDSGNGHALAIGAAFVVAVTSALDLVVGTSDMAWQHRELRRRFLLLEGDIQGSLALPSDLDIVRWRGQRLTIEADEPGIYVALDLLCDNELCRATGREERVKLSFFEIATAHWLRWENLTSRAINRLSKAKRKRRYQRAKQIARRRAKKSH